MISIKILSKKYGNKTVLNNINIELMEGKVYGIVGDNGAGKTTLFRCIAGLEEFEGEILSDLFPLKNHLGLLFTDPYFFSKITGEEYIKLLVNARNIELKEIQEINIFELPLNQYASTYSTGMKKKLAITALLLQKNKYFVLDEPFNGVDIHSNILISEIILRLKRLNKIVLISSHIFSTLKDTCDEIHLLKNGELSKTVQKVDFDLLEQEMKEGVLSYKIDNLEF